MSKEDFKVDNYDINTVLQNVKNDRADVSITPSGSSVIKTHNAYDLVSKKIIICKMSSENLSLQMEYADASIKIQQLAVDIAKRKRELIADLEALLYKQLTDFDKSRNEECAYLYNLLNELDIPSAEFKALEQTLDKKRDEVIDLSQRILYMESTIPNEVLITNYTATIKPEDTAKILGEELGTDPKNLGDLGDGDTLD